MHVYGLKLNRAVKVILREEVERLCKVSNDSETNAKIWDETKGLQTSREWKPVFHNNDSGTAKNCCGTNPKFPREFQSIITFPSGYLWREWEVEHDGLTDLEIPYGL